MAVRCVHPHPATPYPTTAAERPSLNPAVTCANSVAGNTWRSERSWELGLYLRIRSASSADQTDVCFRLLGRGVTPRWKRTASSPFHPASARPTTPGFPDPRARTVAADHETDSEVQSLQLPGRRE